MSAKTKIVVFHMKELIYTGIFGLLGILFILLLVMMLLPGKQDTSTTEESSTAAPSQADIYIPGIYTTELVLGSQSMEVEVIVDTSSVTSIRLVNVSETVTTMYPLLQPVLDSLCSQIYANQTLDSITYSSDSKYTSLVLLEAIQSSLSRASIEK